MLIHVSMDLMCIMCSTPNRRSRVSLRTNLEDFVRPFIGSEDYVCFLPGLFLDLGPVNILLIVGSLTSNGFATSICDLQRSYGLRLSSVSY